jgi:preprotein translocase subunit YajC
LEFLHLLAQATQAVSASQPASLIERIEKTMVESGNVVLLFVMIAMVYLFVFRSKKNKDRDRQKMLKELKRGDEVQTIGGIIGTVVEAREEDVLLKVDETNNTKMRFTRSAIHRVLEQKK